MDELIDFSDRDGEFLDAELKQRALAFAIITSVAGFVLSCWLFLEGRVAPASDPLDRRAAEGRVVPPERDPLTRDGPTFAAFRAPLIKKPDPLERRKVKPPWKDLKVAGAAAADEPVAARKEPERRVVETSLGLVPEYVKKAPSSVRAPQRPERRKASSTDSLDPDRLLFPRRPNRAEQVGLSAVAAAWGRNAFVMGNLQGEYQVGFGLDSEGRALVSSRAAQSTFLARVWVEGTLRRATLLGTDQEFGIALIRVEGASFSGVPLAPAPPSAGETLLAFAARGRAVESRECVAGVSFGRAGFFVDGSFDAGMLGAPLLNDRGELAGFYSTSLPGAPGGGIHLASDSAALYRLSRGYDAPAGGEAPTLADAVARLARAARDGDRQGLVKRGRAIPGVGLGDLYLGLTPEGAERWVSTPRKSHVGPGLELWESPAPPVTLYFANGTLALIATRHTGFATPEGFAPGGTVDLATLSRSYPRLRHVPGRAFTPGLDILLGAGNSVAGLVVKPELTKL